MKNEGIGYYTLHGSKGLEFENVVVVLQDKFAKKENYCKYFFEKYNTSIDSDSQFQEVRNLLYVAFSRAKKNLHVIYKNNNPEHLLENIKDIFQEIHNLNSYKTYVYEV